MPHRILVVDDEEAVRSLMKDYLEQSGYDVLTAVDGRDAIRVFERQHPHLALIDFLLPKKNGFAVAEAIRNDVVRPDTPIIMMSGVFRNPKTAVEAREKYGVVDFLSKPLNLEHVGKLIQTVLADLPFEEETAVPVEPSRSPSIPPPPPPPEPPRAEPPPKAVPKDNAKPRSKTRGLFYHVPPSVVSKPAEAGGRTGPTALVERRAASLSSHGRSSGGTPPPSSQGSGPSRASTGSMPSGSAQHSGASRSHPASAITDEGIYLGRPFPQLSEEGSLEDLPAALVLATIRYNQETGMLDMSGGATHRRIYIKGGRPIFMQSNAEGENVGSLLLRRGRITEPDFQRCLRFMKDHSRTLQQALLDLRLVSEVDLATAYKLLAGQLLPLALGMAAGTYRWRLTDVFVGRVPEGEFEPMTVLLEGIKRHVHPPQIFKFFGGREDVPLLRTTEFPKVMPFFRRTFSAMNIANKVDGHNTYRTLSSEPGADAAQVLPQLFALVVSGMAVLPELDEGNAMQAAVNLAAAEAVGPQPIRNPALDSQVLELERSGGVEFNQDDQRARSAIATYHDDIMSQNFFEIFGVDARANPEKIRTAYFALAKKWHSEAFASVKLGSHEAKLNEIFERLNEAYETITDANQREEYLLFLNRKAKGLPTNAREILRGEQLFDQAQAMIKREDWSGAQQVLSEAIQLNSDDALYYATMGWVTFRLDEQSQANVTEAVQLLKRALQEQGNLSVAYQYLGQISFRRGQHREARKWWKRCLQHEPNNEEAARGIRQLKG